MCSSAGDRDGDEPDHHHGPEERRDIRGAAALHGEQPDQDHDRDRHDEVLGARATTSFKPFDRGQHRDRRRDHAVAEKHRGADDAEQHHERRALADRAEGERHQGERAALAVVVGAQQDQHVFDGHHQDQRPQDHREHAEHDLAGDRARLRRPRSRPRGRRRAGWCRCRHRRCRRCRASAPRSSPEHDPARGAADCTVSLAASFMGPRRRPACPGGA